MKYYKDSEWTFLEEHNQFDYDTNLYVDSSGKPITGILENFKYYSDNDPRNDWFVVEGKRLCSVVDLKEFLYACDVEHEPDCPRIQFWDAGELDCPCTCKEKY
jgi:hypothetical protein